LPVEAVVQDVNCFLRGWAGYFCYGNSAHAFEKITFHAHTRMAGFVAKRRKRRTRYGWWLLSHHPDQIGLISLNGTVVAPRPYRPWRQGAECRR
jgi:RNA-directed DNA polymerase